MHVQKSKSAWVLASLLMSVGVPGFANEATDPARLGSPLPRMDAAGASDVRLEDRVKRALENDATLSNDAKNVTVIAKDGSVTIEGSVKTVAEKERVESIVARVAGAKRVINRLNVSS